MTKAGFWLNAATTSLGVVGFMVAVGFFGYKWLAYMLLTFVFAGVAIAGNRALREGRPRSPPRVTYR